jgi:hypothetical protein
MRAAGIILALVVIFGTACGDDDPAPAPAPAPDGQESPGETTGPVTEVEIEGDAVVAFVVESQGESYRFLVDSSIDYGFDLHHLEEHQTSGDPVLVEFEQRGDGLYALAILDA